MGIYTCRFLHPVIKRPVITNRPQPITVVYNRQLIRIERKLTTGVKTGTGITVTVGPRDDEGIA